MRARGVGGRAVSRVFRRAAARATRPDHGLDTPCPWDRTPYGVCAFCISHFNVLSSVSFTAHRAASALHATGRARTPLGLSRRTADRRRRVRRTAPRISTGWTWWRAVLH